MRFIVFYALAFILLITGCDRPDPVPAPEQENGYIFFSSKLETKTGLIEDPSKIGQFGVVGFKYDSSGSWNEYKAGATPNVFYDEYGELVDAETVDCDSDGDGTYSPLQGWSNTKKYTFFAYYPLDKTSLVNTDGTAYTGGVPAIKYTIDTDAFEDSMIDLMTAGYHKDLSGASSDNVTFSFDHRLSSLGVNLRNSSECTIDVDYITLNVSGIRYDQITLPLDGSTPPVTTGPAEGIDAQEFTMELTSSEKSLSKTGELSDKMIFIPQSDKISVEVSIGYTRSLSGYPDNTFEVTLHAVETDLLEGHKHLIQLNFTDLTVEISSKVDAAGWEHTYDVHDTFN